MFAGLLVLCSFAFPAWALTPDSFLAGLNYSVRQASFNVSNYTDAMSDTDSNGVNDTLSLSITFNSTPGNYSIFTDLHVNGSMLTASANRTAGNPNTLVLNYSTSALQGQRFNYTIRAYDANLSLKYREKGILTNSYNNYQLAYTIVNLTDINQGNTTLLIIATLNVTNTFQADATAYLKHNSTTLTARSAPNLSAGLQLLSFAFNNETIKNTHYIGNFTLTRLRINGRQYNLNYATSKYDYRDFARSSYIYNATERTIDADNDNLFDALRLNTSVYTNASGNYKLQVNVYDLYFNYIKQITKSQSLDNGLQYITVDINGTDFYKRKLTGPYLVYLKLKQGSTVIDELPRHTTAAYNFTQFEPSESPELFVTINVTGDHLYGRRNASVNVTITNNGTIRAYNIFLDVFDNYSFSQTLFISTILVNGSKTFAFNFSNINDTLFTAIADLQNVVEEQNESDNSLEQPLKINRAPSIGKAPSSNPNITTGEQQLFSINYSDDDNVTISWILNGSLAATNRSNYTFIGNLTNAGSYTILVNVSDGYLSNHSSWNLTVAEASQESSPSTGGGSAGTAGSSGSSGDGGCIPNYLCSEWSACINGKQSRKCAIIQGCSQQIAAERNCTAEGNHAPVFILSGNTIENEAASIAESAAAPAANQASRAPAISGAVVSEYDGGASLYIGAAAIAIFMIASFAYFRFFRS